MGLSHEGTFCEGGVHFSTERRIFSAESDLSQPTGAICTTRIPLVE